MLLGSTDGGQWHGIFPSSIGCFLQVSDGEEASLVSVGCGNEFNNILSLCCSPNSVRVRTGLIVHLREGSRDSKEDIEKRYI